MLFLWFGDFLDWQASCQHPLLSRRQELAVFFLAWQLGPLSPDSSFPLLFTFYRLIYTLFKPHASFLGSGQISGGRVVGSGDGVGKGLQESLRSVLPPSGLPTCDCLRVVCENQELLQSFLMSSEPLFPESPGIYN